MKMFKRVLVLVLSVLLSFSMMGNTVWAMTASTEENQLREEETNPDEAEGGAEKDPEASEDCADGHTWGEHQLGEAPTYDDAGTIVHVCTVCGEEEEILEEEWSASDYELAQRKMNFKGEVTFGEKQVVTLSTEEEELGQYFSFIPEETGSYQIHLDNENLSGNFVNNDADLSDMEEGEELQAGQKYYICVLGSGEGTLWLTKAGDKIDISSGYKIIFNEDGPFTVNTDDSPVEPDIDVVSINDEGDSDVTFDVDYENNTSAGKAVVIATGTGRYTGELRKEFTIEKLDQEPDLSSVSNLSLAEEESKKVTLEDLIGDVTITPAEEGYVEVTKEEGELCYSIKAVKYGTVFLTITASGNNYYKEYKGKVKIIVSKAAHHHTYLMKDEKGEYVKDTTKGEYHKATCKEAEYTLYKCEDEECGYEEKVLGSSELAPHTWGDHEASDDEDKMPTYDNSGTLVHVCTVCGEEEEIEEEDWDEGDYKLVQRLKNDVKDASGNVVKLEEGKTQTLTLSTYNDDEYGQFLTFIPKEDEAYQIKVKEIEGADFETVFVQDDVELTELSSAETLKAGTTYYVCVRGTGKCEVSVNKVVKQINIADEGYQVKFVDDLNTKEFEADGTPIEPEIEEVTPKYEDEEVTYNVTYKDNINPGTGTVYITGSGNYTGTITKTFKIVPKKQTLDLADITLAEEKDPERTIDLSELVGEITFVPSEAGIIEVKEKETAAGDDGKLYTVKALKAGKLTLTIKAAGDTCYQPFEKTIYVYISKAEHHHTYLSKDASGNYTVYKPANGTSIKAYPATCIKAAYTVYKCEDKDCGTEETVVDPKGALAAHKYKEEVIKPTCMAEGYTKEVCTVCGYTQIKENSSVEKLDHDFEYKETIAATENSRAYNLYECEVCHIQQREYFGCVGGATANGKHTFVSQVVKPTCTKDGYTKNTCTVCGYSETVDETDSLGHDMKETKYAPTESSYGYTHSECSRCGYYVDTITSCKVRIVDGKEVFEHEGTPISGSESQEDCTKPGTRKYKCTLCKRTYEKAIPEELPAKEHTWVVEKGDEATCEEDGLKSCTVCKTTEVIAKLGHKKVKDEANSRPATYDEKGVNAYKCSNEGCEQTWEEYTKRLCDYKGTIAVGSKALNIPEGKNAHGYYYKFSPAATKNYFVTGNDVFDTTFCEMDDDLTELGDAALLTKGKTYYVCINGEGQGKVTISNITDFIDIKKQNCKIQILDDPASIVYTGEEVELDNVRLLKPDNTQIDFAEDWVTYKNNVNAGTATISITGKGKYTGTISKTFTINKAAQDIEEKYLDLQVGEIKELDKWEFFGDNISVTVPEEQKGYVAIIPIEKGYKLQGKKVGTVNLHIHADGDANYKAIDVTIPVTIMAKGHIHSFGEVDAATGNPTGETDEKKIQAMIAQAPADLAVKGSFQASVDNKKSRVTLISRNCEDGNTYKIQCLEEGCNYEIDYLDEREEIQKEHVYKTHTTPDGDVETDGTIIEAPTYDTMGKKEVTCTVCGAKTIEEIDCLERVDLSDLEVELSRTYFMYDGKEKRPAVKVYDEDEKVISPGLYTVTYQNNKNPGANTARVLVKAKTSAKPQNDKYCGSVTVTYSIVQSALSKSKIVAGSSAKLTLKGIYTIDDYEMNRDGIISWNRKTGAVTGKKAGKVRLTIYGYDKDDNDITVSVNVTVLPKATAISKVKPLKKGKVAVSWKVNKTCGGYQVQYSLDKKFKKKVKTVKVTKRTAKSVTLKGLKAKKTYYIRMRSVDSKAAKVVSAWSKVKKVKVK